MRPVGVFGTLLISGPLVISLGTFFLDEFTALPRVGGRDFRTVQEKLADDKDVSHDSRQRWRMDRVTREKNGGVLWSAAKVRGTVVVVKFGASTVETARKWLADMLVYDGTIATVFGEHALLCLR